MKKFYYLIATAIMAFTFTSCEDVPAPFGQPVHISGDTEDDPSGGDDSGLAVNEDFKAAGKLTWSVTNVVAPDGVDVWQYDSRYGLKATAYAGGANNAAESWLICPEPYNFSNVSGAKMTIKHAANYFSDGAEKECKVLASTNYATSVADATWTEIKIDTWPTSWDFVEGTGDMSAFDGKDKVYIAFKYTSTATKSGTWEIEKITVEGGGSSSGGSDTPTPSSNYGTAEAPLTVAQAIALIDAETTVSEAYVKGKISQIDSYNSTYHSITYWISDDGGTTTQLQVYSGKGKDGADFAAKEDLTVGQTVTVKGALKKFNDTYEFDKNNQIVSIGEASGGGDSGSGTGSAYGTAEAPLTVAQAIALIDAETTVSEAYVKGKISQIDSYNSTYHSITYWISDDGGTTTQLQVYSGKGKDGADFAAKEDLTVGQTVVIKGALKKFNSTYEFDKNNVILSIADASGGGSDTGSVHGTEAAPLTVAQAIALIDAETTIDEAYVKGKISQVDSYNTKYKSITYWISDDGTTTTQLQVYSGKGKDGADFAAKEDLTVGQTVVIKGALKKFNSTYEFDKNNVILSIN